MIFLCKCQNSSFANMNTMATGRKEWTRRILCSSLNSEIHCASVPAHTLCNRLWNHDSVTDGNGWGSLWSHWCISSCFAAVESRLPKAIRFASLAQMTGKSRRHRKIIRVDCSSGAPWNTCLSLIQVYPIEPLIPNSRYLGHLKDYHTKNQITTL